MASQRKQTLLDLLTGGEFNYRAAENTDSLFSLGQNLFSIRGLRGASRISNAGAVNVGFIEGVCEKGQVGLTFSTESRAEPVQLASLEDEGQRPVVVKGKRSFSATTSTRSESPPVEKLNLGAVPLDTKEISSATISLEVGQEAKKIDPAVEPKEKDTTKKVELQTLSYQPLLIRCGCGSYFTSMEKLEMHKEKKCPQTCKTNTGENAEQGNAVACPGVKEYLETNKASKYDVEEDIITDGLTVSDLPTKSRKESSSRRKTRASKQDIPTDIMISRFLGMPPPGGLWEEFQLGDGRDGFEVLSDVPVPAEDRQPNNNLVSALASKLNTLIWNPLKTHPATPSPTPSPSTVSGYTSFPSPTSHVSLTATPSKPTDQKILLEDEEGWALMYPNEVERERAREAAREERKRRLWEQERDREILGGSLEGIVRRQRGGTV